MLVLMTMSGILVLQIVSVKNCDVNIKFLYANSPVAQFLGLVVKILAESQYMILL